MRSATSVGANINEAIYGNSKEDFISKLHISLKETGESIYWLTLLFKIQCVTDSQSCVEPEEGEPIPLDYLPDVAMEKIKAIREIVLEREKTINKMLDFYLKLYQDIENDEKE